MTTVVLRSEHTHARLLRSIARDKAWCSVSDHPYGARSTSISVIHERSLARSSLTRAM